MVEKKQTTHFGFEDVAVDDKVERVRGVFDSVADKYDVMNDVMSFGVHRYWKSYTIEQAELEPGFKVLDLAGGTGDLAAKMAPIVGKTGQVVLSDINYQMLKAGRNRLVDEALVGNIDYVQADAEKLPFATDYFDCVTIAFGLRNVTDKDTALRTILRVLKPGGRLLVLEFSKPVLAPLEKLYDVYSFNILPVMGKLIANDADSYRYLAESIRKHPAQEELKAMMIAAGFCLTKYDNLNAGIVALHSGFKPE